MKKQPALLNNPSTPIIDNITFMKTPFSLALLPSILFLASCGGGSEPSTETTGAAKDSSAGAKLRTVEAVPLTAAPFYSYIDIQGKVDATENVSLNAEMPGTVAKVNVELGQTVNAGQVLAELDAKVIQQGIAELQNALDLATTFYEKQKNLWDQKIGTEIQFLTAKNQKEGLEKKMATLQEQLKMSKIISPISGVVDAIDIKLGQATMPGMPAIRVVNLSSLEVKGEVAETYLAKVKTGNEVVIILPDLQDTVKSRITYAARVISPLNRTFTITTKVNGKNEYHPNQVAIIKIVDYSNPKALVVPVGVIQHAREGDFLFIAKGNKATKVKVKAGKLYNGKAEIVDGLNENDKVITKGFQELNDGEEIKF